MTIKVNGASRQVADGIKLLDLLKELSVRPEHVAVERNLSVVPKREFETCVIQEGDELEIVTLVGGG